MPKEAERKLKKEIAKRGGQVAVKTIHPNPHNPKEYARVYVVRMKGPRGGKTIRGPIMRQGQEK